MEQAQLALVVKGIAAHGKKYELESSFRQLLGKLYKLLKKGISSNLSFSSKDPQDIENEGLKERVEQMKEALQVAKTIVNASQKGWFGRFIKAKKQAKKLGTALEDVSRDVHKAINLLSYVALAKMQWSVNGKERTILWIDDNPDNNTKEVRLRGYQLIPEVTMATDLGIKVVQVQSSEEAWVYLSKHSETLRTASPSQFRIVTDSYRPEDHGEMAAHHFIKK